VPGDFRHEKAVGSVWSEAGTQPAACSAWKLSRDLRCTKGDNKAMQAMSLPVVEEG
jgi:hypothetical protein